MMQRNVVPLGGTVLGVGFLGQAQEEPFRRFPIWIWILLAAVVIVVAVIWTLREEGEEAAGKQAEARPATPAAPAKAKVAPAREPATRAPEAVDVQPAAVAVGVPEVAEEVEPPEPPSPVAEAPPAVPPTPLKPDDLKVIEGIGPKISGLLHAAGVRTFAQLANTDVERLRQILVDANLTRLADPGTWPEQAALAAAGDWDGLKALQDSLKGGRRV